MPARTTGWSSLSRSRITSPPPGSGSTRRCRRRGGLDVGAAAEALGAAADGAQAERLGGSLGALEFRRVEPDAVVDDVERDLVAEVAERDLGAVGVGVLDDVGERALGDAQEGRLDRHRQRHGLAAQRERDPGACARLTGLLVGGRREAAERRRQRLLVQCRRSEFADEPARLVQVLRGGLASEPELVARGRVDGLAFGGVQEELDAGEPLGDGVVDLARDALALGEAARLAARGGEFLLVARRSMMSDCRSRVSTAMAR
ncbi:hypothetical protein GCM10025870_03400 [Agromyces marinus]|uniref:Uncharacterized protein n=1 Tax=Agromyces marinus TaxID=1389020 RepID=A0ABM8GXP4_9MICO|nr:hypothetical protein [Agromyces marinus]BDZ53267.1 hypothetical protein GCM10025870_03400 [Agromyces marinus]